MGIDAWTFLIIIIVNTLIAVIYLLVFHIYLKENDTGYFTRALVMFICPVIGPLYFLLGWVWRKVFFHKPVDLVDVIFSKDRESTLFRANEDDERNIVPVEDAVTVTDKYNARELMLEVLKHDVRNTLASISTALNSEDSEISHYAASVLQSELGKFRNSIQKLTAAIDECEEKLREAEDYYGELRTEECVRLAQIVAGRQNFDKDKDEANDTDEQRYYYADISPKLELSEDYAKHNDKAYEQGRRAFYGEEEEQKTLGQILGEQVMLAHKLIDEVCGVLDQRVLSDMEREGFVTLIDRMGSLIEKRDVLSTAEIERIAMERLNMSDLDNCMIWCEKLMLYYPDSLENYSCRLKLYFTKGDRENFFTTMDEMKKAGVVLSHEMLEMVRVFS